DGRGGTATQQFVLSVIQDLPNQPPVFTSTPVTQAYVNTPYTYQAAATDADQDALSYSLIYGPAGMTVDAGTGLVQWTPTADQRGTISADGPLPVRLAVDDGRGGTAQQSFNVCVLPQQGNSPPIIVSTPVTQYQLGPASTKGGAIFVTGEDPDFHGTIGPNQTGALDLIRDALAFVRNGNPKPFLWVESNIRPPFDHTQGINAIKAAGFVEGSDFVHV